MPSSAVTVEAEGNTLVEAIYTGSQYYRNDTYHRWQNFHHYNIFVNNLFQRKLNTRNILCNICQPIPILVAKVWRRKLDYMKNLQAKYFTGENIPIYGIHTRLVTMKWII